jgi:hypothetical protein
MNATDTLSSANSRLLELEVNGIDKFVVYKSGSLYSNGSIGLGTETPTAGRGLTLNNASNYFGIDFQVAGNTVGKIIQEATGNMYYDANGDMIFRTNTTTERARINTAGMFVSGYATVASMNVVPTIQSAFGAANTAQTTAVAAFAKANTSAPLTGGGTSGNWPINITGTAYYTYNLTQGFNSNWNTDFAAAPAGSMVSRGDTSSGASTGGPGNTWWFQQNYRHNNGSSYWGVQIAWGWEDNMHRLMTRNWQNGSATAWIEYINTNNGPSYIGSFAVGSVGSYALLRPNTLTAYAPGDQVAGSSLGYTNVNGNAPTISPAGSWRLMGDTAATSGSTATSVWLRYA